MKRISLLVVFLALVAAQAGCSPLGVAKRGLAEIQGVKGKVFSLRDTHREFYENLSGVRIGEVTNTIEPLCEPELRHAVEDALNFSAEKASRAMSGRGGVSTVMVDIAFNAQPSNFESLVGGKGALLIGRVALLDAQNMQVADWIVVVSSKAVRVTSYEMAEEFAKTLLEYLEPLEPRSGPCGRFLGSAGGPIERGCRIGNGGLT